MDNINSIINADVIDGLKQISDNTVTLICTSPPYNLNIDYSSADDNQPYQKYVKWLADVFRECYRVLRKGGRLLINIDAMTNRQDDKDMEYVRDIRTDLANELKPMGFKFFGEHVWYKSNACPCKGGGAWNGRRTAWGSYANCSFPAVRRNHEYILVYSKEQFKLEKDAFSGNTDIQPDEFQQWISSVWAMNAETRKLGNHPVPFPVELPMRCIKLYSYPNDIILDPFNGVGTTTMAASVLNRRYIGIDMDANYCEFARDRISSSSSCF